jgi:hypothetical protein
VVLAVVVVVVQVVREVASEAGEADLEVARERGSPARFEDRAVQSFDVPVGLWAPGADLAVQGAGREPRGELAAPELGAVVSLRIRSRRQPACWSSAAMRRASAEVCSTLGPLGPVTTSSAQAKLE